MVLREGVGEGFRDRELCSIPCLELSIPTQAVPARAVSTRPGVGRLEKGRFFRIGARCRTLGISRYAFHVSLTRPISVLLLGVCHRTRKGAC